MTDPATAALADLLLRSARLKTVPRTGWALRGVRAPESVADHAHGTALATLLLLDLDARPLDRARALAMAVLHDLPESVTGDWPAVATRLLPPGAKSRAEAAALDEVLGGAPVAGAWRDLWREYDQRATPEARLVRDADRLDMLVQALAYERATGTRELDGFWAGLAAEPPESPAARALAEALAGMRA